ATSIELAGDTAPSVGTSSARESTCPPWRPPVTSSRPSWSTIEDRSVAASPDPLTHSPSADKECPFGACAMLATHAADDKTTARPFRIPRIFTPLGAGNTRRSARHAPRLLHTSHFLPVRGKLEVPAPRRAPA